MRLIREENINTVEYWNRVYDFERRSGHRRQYNDLWEQMLKHLPPGQEYLVDIGCGAGEFLRFVGQHRPEYHLYGTDQSYQGILTASGRCPGASLHLANEKSFNLPPLEFGIVTVCEVMEHISDPEVFLGRVTDLTRPKGLIILTTPWRWGRSCPEHVLDYESPHDFVLLGKGRLELIDSMIIGYRRFLVTVLRRTI